MKLWLVKLPNGDLRAIEPEKIKRHAVGDALLYDFKKYRNYQFLKKFFALIKVVYDIEEIEKEFASPEHMRYVLLIEAGYFEMVTSPSGQIYVKVDSISFENMDEAEFSELYDKITEIVLSWLPKYIDRDLHDLQKRLLSFT